MNCYKSLHKQIVMRSKKHLENYPSSIILIGMLVIKMYKRNFWKLNVRIKRLLMSRKETPMTCLAKRVWGKFKKDPNLKVVILEPKCLSHCRLSILVGQVCIVLEGDKYANIVKGLAMCRGCYINVMRVVVVGRWWERLMSRVKWNKCRWSVNNVMAVGMLVGKSVQFAMERKLSSNQEIYTLKYKRVWERVIRYYSRANHNKDLNSTLETYI